MLQLCASTCCKNIHRKAIYEEYKHMVDILYKDIKNPE